MKILSINDYNSLIGGTEVGTKTLCEELRKKDHEILYLGCGEWDYDWNTYALPLLERSKDIHRTSLIEKLKIGRRWMFWGDAYEKTKNVIKKEKPDIAHVHNIFYQLSIAPLVALREMKIPTIMTIHDHRIYCPRGTLCDKKGKYCNRTVGLGCAY